MAEETPSLPPPQVPIRGYTTPVNQEGFFSERIDYTTPEYRVIPRGTKYSTILGADPNVIDQFAELYFLRETREIGAYPWAMRFWATDTLAEDSYNSSVEYVSEAVTFPAYTRVYTVRRDSYEANTTLPIGGTLTSIIAIKVIDGGQDYTQATITIDDSVGSDATAEPVIDVDGTIASIVVTNCGQDYTTVPTVTITGDGGGAVAIAIIQPQTAYLVSQKKTEFPDEKQNTGGMAYMHPLKNEYVIITRIYETLPGPWVYSYKEDIDGALLTVKTRRNIGVNIVVAESIDGVNWQDVTAKGVDNFVSEETVESRTIVIDNTTAGTATHMTTSRVDEDGKTVTVTRSQASAAYLASISPRETIVTGIWKRITSEPISHLKVWLITETRPLPGNPVPSSKLDPDGIVVSIVSTLKDTTTITPSETLIAGVWTEITKEAVSDLVAKEIVMSRAIPGNTMTLTKIEEDGKVMTTSRILSDQTTIVSAEAIVGGNTWTRTYQEDPPVFRGFAIKGGDLVAWKIVESRPIPGNALVTTKIDEDGKPITITKTMVDTTTVVSAEAIVAGVWTRTYKEEISDLVAWKVVETRALPGNPIPSTQLDKDGKAIDIVRTLKDQSTITTGETLGVSTWTKTTQEKVTDLVSWEVVEARPVPGNVIPSATIDGDSEVVNTSTKLRDESAITPASSESGGFITEVSKREVSDLVSDEITKVTRWLDKATYSVSIPEGIIPLEFRANVTTTVESHIIAGTASMPTLGVGEFEHTKRQLTKLLYEERITKLTDLSFPIVQTGTETSSQFGGAVLDVVRTLSNVLLTADEGVDIVSSYVNPIGDSLMWFKETKKRPVTDATWPILYGTHVDPKYDLIINIQKQTVDAGTVGSVITNGIIDVQSHDKWKSIQITSTLDVDSLPEDVQWFGSMRYSFPPELTDAVIDWATASCSCSSSFSAVLIANIAQYSGPVKTRITEQFYNGPPPDDVTITQFFPQTHHFGYAWWSACGDSDGNCRTKTGAPEFHIPLCLHDDLTLSIGEFITFPFAATSPAVLPHGSYIMIAPHVERWRFGVFRRVLVEVLVP